MPHDDVDRRTFLRYGGTAIATVGIAGCLGDDGEDTPEDTPDVGDDDTDADDTDGDDTDGDDADGTDTDADDDGDGNGDDGDEFEVTVTQGQLTDTLDPVGDNSTPTYNIIDQGYEPFLYRDRDGRPIELIVTDWERTDDQEVTLQIRDDAVFHSGSDVTPEDVAYSINRANDPDVSDVAATIGDIEEAYAEDGAVVVDMNAVEPAIFRNLNAFGRVVEQEWVEERDGNIDEEMNGTGPYQLEEFVDDTRVAYTKFDDYWGEEPEPDACTFNAVPEEGPRIDRLLAGDTDLIVNVRPDDIPEVEDADNADVEFVPSIRSIFLVMNDVFEPFDSQEFRQAMNYAVDVQAIIDSLLNEFGDRTSQPTLPDHTGYNPDLEPYEHDPGRAEELVDESGFADVELELHTPIGRYLKDVDIAETAAAQIDELSNVSCSVNRRDFGELVGELVADQDESPAFFLIGWGNPTFDANYTMSPWFRPGAFQHFEDEELSQLLEDANDLPDGEERAGILQEANAVARDLAPWVFLHQQYSIYGISDRIEWEARQDEDIIVKEFQRA